jgi:hypothetical protein
VIPLSAARRQRQQALPVQQRLTLAVNTATNDQEPLSTLTSGPGTSTVS